MGAWGWGLNCVHAGPGRIKEGQIVCTQGQESACKLLLLTAAQHETALLLSKLLALARVIRWPWPERLLAIIQTDRLSGSTEHVKHTAGHSVHADVYRAAQGAQACWG